ncbi:glycoside hydrolase family protein [Ensifer oleiphilus]|uniref:glycoside hydrolase family protein n=1 Tax=Ensifer oleiphilus TaxID=2742698 RepID=UPI003CCED225
MGGLKTRAYRNVSRIWTVACGHTSTAGVPVVLPSMAITEAEAEQILQVALAKSKGAGLAHGQGAADRKSVRRARVLLIQHRQAGQVDAPETAKHWRL